ncbi:hypothetical protein CK203_113431 [Vitis vinifera]|uniref:DUF4283 domain-containing protein n=1 Tax=Vitis vinifera TaxID=29760 RepID=A0A438BPG0_VITVI|nr:hypothetical protein CK203_113431 [Vitis vinifera]
MAELGISNRKEPRFCSFSRIWYGGAGLVDEAFEESCGVEGFQGIIRKIRGKTKTLLMEICFNNRGRFMKITEIVTKRKPLFLVVPEGVKGKRWEDLRKAILSVLEYPDQVGGALKEKNGDIQMNKDIYRGGRSYAEVVAEAGFRTGGMLSARKWARAVICESQEKVQDWTHEGKAIVRMMGMKGMVSINPISTFKGCFFVSSTRRAEQVHDQGRLLVKGRTILLRKCSAELHFEEMGEGNEGGKGNFEVGGLDEGEAVVEMLPNVVFPALLEVEDGVWTYTVAVSVIGEDDEADTVTSETTHSRNEWVKAEGCVSQSSKVAEGLRGSIRDNECYRRRRLPLARYRHSRTSLEDKGENVWGRSSLGQ